MPYNSKIRIFFCFLIIAALSLGGCKSHKKSQKQDKPEISAIEIKPKKKKGKKVDEISNLIAEEALTWIGTPYAYGASTKGKATDCSGMVLVVYKQIANINMPRNSAKQADFCHDLKENEVSVGDLVFFATGKDKNQISHVGIMLDNIRFVHASASKGVIVSDMSTPYYRRTFKKYGRVPR